jgi:hypothetical protein
MKNQKSENFQRFASAFFRTAEEKRIQLNPDQRHRALCALAGMHHWYHTTDQFHLIRNGEKLADLLARKQGAKTR